MALLGDHLKFTQSPVVMKWSMESASDKGLQSRLGGTPSFPTTAGAFETVFKGGGFCRCDGFVSKLNPTGSALTYSTYLGGSDGEESTAIAVDAAGNAYVSGLTFFSDFPITPGAFQTTYENVCSFVSCPAAFVSKLNAAGWGLVYSTFLAGSLSTGSFGITHFAIAIDAATNAYVAGDTTASDFPTTPGAFQTTYENVCSFVPCPAAFVSKLNAAGWGLVYSTFLGGSDYGGGIAVDPSGSAHVTGRVFAADLPTTTGAFQTTYKGYNAFVSKLNPAGSALLYSTYLGGTNGFEEQDGAGIAIDPSGNVYVTVIRMPPIFPPPRRLPDQSQGVTDAFVTKIALGTAELREP
jgi:Beta-propeller repeat